MSDLMTLEDVRTNQARPENANRPAVLVYEDGLELVTYVDGREFRWSNIFGLDSMIDGYAPRPRNLYCVSKADAEAWAEDGEVRA